MCPPAVVARASSATVLDGVRPRGTIIIVASVPAARGFGMHFTTWRPS
jgi:hypothetical protein